MIRSGGLSKSGRLSSPPFYFLVFVAVYLAASGKLSTHFPSLITLAVVPLVLAVGIFKEKWYGWVSLFGIFVAYESLELVGLSGSGAESLYLLDHSIWGTNLTGLIQRTLDSTGSTVMFTVLYTLHLPLIIGTSIFLWLQDRGLFDRYVAAAVVLSYVSLAVFVLFPTSPPWSDGTAKNLLSVNGVYSRVLGPIPTLTTSVEPDAYASFPSLHAGFAVLFALAVSKKRPSYLVVALPLAIGILVSTLYLGQHYSVDLISGSVFALTAFLLSRPMTRRAASQAG